MFVNGKELQGKFNIDSCGFAFESNGKKYFLTECDWKKVTSKKRY